MIFEALPARFGDCLLLHAPDGAKRRLMVIDGGPGTVFNDSLAPRLKALAAGAATLPIDAVMVSHIDADHIVGIIGLLTAIKKAKLVSAQPPYRVSQLLFNSFDKIVASKPEELASGSGSALQGLHGPSIVLGAHETVEVLASVGQGSELDDLARALKIPLNPPAKGGLLQVDDTPTRFKFGEAEFLIVGPRVPELNALRKAWAEWRAKKDAEALKALAAYADKSVPNLSSIVALVTWKQKRLLLTGDARGDYILEGLEITGVLPKGGVLAKPIDILKFPHHGSINNVQGDFLHRLPARHYVASGDGWFGNPDKETLELLHAARPGGDYVLHLTYPAAHMDQEHAKYLAQQKKPKTFDPKKHSVAPILQQMQNAGAIIRIGPARIDLSKE